MLAVLEKPTVGEHAPQLATAAPQTGSPLPPPPPPPPALATALQQHLNILDCKPGPCIPEGIFTAAAGWTPKTGLFGVPGTGEPDVDVVFPASGPTFPTEVADFLDYAAERIVRFGWVQGTERQGDFVCSVGALRVRRDDLTHMSSGRATRLANHALAALTNHLHRKGNVEGVIGWNDTPGRTMEEVVAAFREAAEELRSDTPPSIYYRAVLG